jgi:hypothetical protein
MTGRKESAVGTTRAGKTALITGPGPGIGRTVALGLADADAVAYPPELVKTERFGEPGGR